jgi:hypothetical protein
MRKRDGGEETSVASSVRADCRRLLSLDESAFKDMALQ